MDPALPEPPQAKEGSPFAKVGECLYRHRASGTYYALVKRDGRQFRRSLKTSDRALAVRRLAELREKLGSLSKGANAASLTFSELAQRWLPAACLGLKPKSAERKRVALVQLAHFFGPHPLRNITRRQCDDWATGRAERRAASTYNIERENLLALFSYAQREGLILSNPADHLPRRRLQKRVLDIPTKEQFGRLVETMRSLDSRARAGADLVELLAYSGMRLGEAVAMRWRDVDLERQRFFVTGGEQGTKNHEARAVPLFPGLRTLLVKLIERSGPAPDALVIGIASAKNSMATACKLAGLPAFTHHSLRHFFVSNAIEVGADFKVIAAWVGHKDGGVLVAKTYGHLRDTHSVQMARKMSFSADNNELQPAAIRV